ncbi:hypothetical protein BJD55_gp164 [Gordonia phage Yvonnetastic]|uniref:Minor tail protein n=1 Tax=Gordonia phage Yvonnetastic TaxID=1821566 RepID=A0A142K919_9CAUD|nr:hypothetical protein BJD55_gp164 [Gordonia phage Yvonnetastic]AMS02602.1 hypothetical protein SEA_YVONNETASTIC_58 [Gordonia phage Yvonnetastic]
MHVYSFPPPAAPFVKQQINKVGRFSFSNLSPAVPVTGWSSDGTSPGTLVSDSILDVVGSSGLVTVHALVRLGRNSTSGIPTVQLVVNGAVVDSVEAQPNSTQFGNTDPLRGRPSWLQWTGSINAGDDIMLSALRTTSTTGYVNDGSYLLIEPGNTTYTMQRMYKNTSTFSVPNSRAIVTGWTADAKYPGSTVSSNQLATTLSGTGTARAYIVSTGNNSPVEAYLMMDGVDIGSVTIPGSDATGYWITVPNVTFTGSNLLKLEARRTNTSFTRAIEDNSPVIEASIP